MEMLTRPGCFRRARPDSQDDSDGIRSQCALGSRQDLEQRT